MRIRTSLHHVINTSLPYDMMARNISVRRSTLLSVPLRDFLYYKPSISSWILSNWLIRITPYRPTHWDDECRSILPHSLTHSLTVGIMRGWGPNLPPNPRWNRPLCMWNQCRCRQAHALHMSYRCHLIHDFWIIVPISLVRSASGFCRVPPPWRFNFSIARAVVKIRVAPWPFSLPRATRLPPIANHTLSSLSRRTCTLFGFKPIRVHPTRSRRRGTRRSLGRSISLWH